MGISSVLRFIERAGGWPMIMNRVEFAQTPKIPWQSIERTYNFLTGSSPIFNLAVSVNLRSNDKNIITVRDYIFSDILYIFIYFFLFESQLV